MKSFRRTCSYPLMKLCQLTVSDNPVNLNIIDIQPSGMLWEILHTLNSPGRMWYNSTGNNFGELMRTSKLTLKDDAAWLKASSEGANMVSFSEGSCSRSAGQESSCFKRIEHFVKDYCQTPIRKMAHVVSHLFAQHLKCLCHGKGSWYWQYR